MQDETFFDSIKRNLNGQPGQPIVLGVCKTLAARLALGSYRGARGRDLAAPRRRRSSRRPSR